MEKFDKQKYIDSFNEKTYSRKTFRLKKDEMERVEEFIKNNTDLSVNAFIREAVLEKIEKMKKSI